MLPLYTNAWMICSKHADSTVLVMELLGESMSMLRVSPDAIHGVPVSKCVAVGIEASPAFSILKDSTLVII